MIIFPYAIQYIGLGSDSCSPAGRFGEYTSKSGANRTQSVMEGLPTIQE
jgi:hypothetical protein